MNLKRFKYLAVMATVLLALLLSNSGATAVQYGWAVQVKAGQWDRHNTVVSFQYDPKNFPSDPTGSRAYLQDLKGNRIPLQFDGTTAWFVLRDLKAGQPDIFLIKHDSGKSSRDTPGVELTRIQNRLEIKIRGHRCSAL